LFRHKPEHYGYLPDGAVEQGEAAAIRLAKPALTTVDMSTGQAVKSGTFWSLVALSLCHMMVMSATITHVMPYLSSIGFLRSKASIVAAAIPIVSIAGRLLFGWLGDRFDKRLVTAGTFLMIGLGIFCFGLASTGGFWLIIPFILLFGIGYGGSNSVRIALARQYFGRSNFGTIFGIILGISVVGGIAAPPAAGWVFDTWGSYRAIWFVYAALPFAVLGTVFALPRAASNNRQ